MTAVVGTDCQDPRSAPLATDEWSRFLNPVLLLLLYYVLSFESQFLLSNKVSAAAVSVPRSSPCLASSPPPGLIPKKIPVCFLSLYPVNGSIFSSLLSINVFVGINCEKQITALSRHGVYDV